MTRWRSMQFFSLDKGFVSMVYTTLTQPSRQWRQSETVPCWNHSFTAVAKSSGCCTGQACVRSSLPYAAVCGFACRPIEHRRRATVGLSPNCGKPGRPTATINVFAGQGRGHSSLHRVSAILCHAANEVSGGLVEGGAVVVREEAM